VEQIGPGSRFFTKRNVYVSFVFVTRLSRPQIGKTYKLAAYKCVHDNQMYNVFNTQGGSVYIVDLDQKNCSCAFRDQLQLPCKHLLCVLMNLIRHDTIDFGDEKYKIIVGGISWKTAELLHPCHTKVWELGRWESHQDTTLLGTKN